MKWNIELSGLDIDRHEINAVVKVLKNRWLTMGGVTRQFEKMFARKIGVRHAFAVTNCTAALHIANIALGMKAGDEVICPALTFVASANATKYTGADVVFANSISENDLTVDPADIERKITRKTKAITVVHYAGFPCLMDEIMRISRRHNLKVIEDCAHSPLAWWKFKNGTKKFVGSIGDIGCFSFFGNKNMTTAEGGMITTNDDELAKKISLLRSHGMTSLTYDRHKGHIDSYDVVMLGYNYRIDEIRSAIGIEQLKKLEKNNARRRKIFKWYLEALMRNDNIVVPFRNRNICQATPHIMPIIVKSGYKEIKERLKKAQIQTSKHYNIVSGFKLYKKVDFKSKMEYVNNLLSLPMSQSMTSREVISITKCLK